MKCISGTGLCLACFLYPEITSGYKHGVTAEEGPAPHPTWYLRGGLDPQVGPGGALSVPGEPVGQGWGCGAHRSVQSFGESLSSYCVPGTVLGAETQPQCSLCRHWAAVRGLT